VHTRRRSRAPAPRPSQDRNAQLGESNERAADGFGSERSRVELRALDEHIGLSGEAPQPIDLKPEAAIDDREMQVTDTFPLDDCAPRLVIADRKRAVLDRHPKSKQALPHPALALVNVNHNVHQRRRKSPLLTASPPVPVQDGHE
jgi:hypothetical protein